MSTREGQGPRPKLDIDSRGRLIVSNRERDPKAVEAQLKLRNWWKTQVALPFLAKAQAWLEQQDARLADANTNRGSHDATEDEREEQLEEILRSSRGYHFDVESILALAKSEMRGLEYRTSIETGAVRGFLIEFVDILANARGLSSARKTELKISIFQSKWQL